MTTAYFDLHCDTASELVDKNRELYKNDGHYDLLRAGKQHPCAQFFAIFGDAKDPLEGRFEMLYNKLISEIKKNNALISLCRSGGELRAAAEEGRIAALLSLEGAEVIGCEPAGLRMAHGLGVRMSGITWNHDNALSGCSKLSNKTGLTQKGREYVLQAVRLGVILDVSHLSDAGFYDIADMTERPFVASHSNARSVCPHHRNLLDDQIKIIIEKGGLIGVNLYAPFLAEGGLCSLDDVYRHIDHILSLGGENALSLGADFDGCDELPEGVSGVQDMHALYEYLLKRKLPEHTIKSMFYDNAQRFFEKHLA